MNIRQQQHRPLINPKLCIKITIRTFIMQNNELQQTKQKFVLYTCKNQKPPKHNLHLKQKKPLPV